MKFNKALITSDKVIISGNMIEFFQFEKPIAIGLKSKPRCRNPSSVSSNECKEQIYKRNARNSCYKLQRLIATNFLSKYSSFFTLTFRNTNEFDITSIVQCNAKLTYFIQRKLRACKIFCVKWKNW